MTDKQRCFIHVRVKETTWFSILYCYRNIFKFYRTDIVLNLSVISMRFQIDLNIAYRQEEV